MKQHFFQNYIKSSVGSIIFLTILCGLVYPVLVTSILTPLFKHEANGSLIEDEGQLRGSELIGQSFSSEKYFWSRPSATAQHPYDASASSGSNLGPSNPLLFNLAKERVKVLQAMHGESQRIPVDLVTASGSGLDPDISVASAIYQSKRVAKARQMEHSEVLELIESLKINRQFKVLGEPRVNVVMLNLALDEKDIFKHE